MGCVIEAGRARLVSRHARGWSDSFPTVCEAARSLPLQAALLDGELAVLLPNGQTSFQALQQRSSLPPGARVVYFVFDVVHHNGRDVGRRPYDERKALLEEVLAPAAIGGVLRYVPHIIGDGPRVLAHACALGAEGIVSKRRTSIYLPGRSRDWRKSKCVRVEPFVVGGFTAAGNSVGSLLVGFYDQEGALRYAGSVGTGKGFTREFLRAMRTQLDSIGVGASPFADFSPRELHSQWGKQHALPTHWVNPLAVVEIGYLEWTHGGQLRRPSFQRLRPDLLAKNIVRP